MLLMKAGECLSYGLGHELFKKNPEKKNHQLKAFLIYFTLMGYIKRDSMTKLYQLMEKSWNSLLRANRGRN